MPSHSLFSVARYLCATRSSHQQQIIFVFTNFWQAFVFRQWICLMFHLLRWRNTLIFVPSTTFVHKIVCLHFVAQLCCSFTSKRIQFPYVTTVRFDVFQHRSLLTSPAVFRILFWLNDIFHFGEQFTKETLLAIVLLLRHSSYNMFAFFLPRSHFYLRWNDELHRHQWCFFFLSFFGASFNFWASYAWFAYAALWDNFPCWNPKRTQIKFLNKHSLFIRYHSADGICLVFDMAWKGVQICCFYAAHCLNDAHEKIIQFTNGIHQQMKPTIRWMKCSLWISAKTNNAINTNFPPPCKM